MLTQQQIDNGGVDLDFLGDVVNGSPTANGDGTATNRLGAKVKTIAKVVQDIEDATDSLPGLAPYRQTLAAAVADPALPVGSYFMSTDDDAATAQTGNLRTYKRIAGAPYYQDMGDAAAPVSRKVADKLAGITLADAVAGRNDPSGNVEQIQIVGRGIYVKSAVAPSGSEITYQWAITDAGGTHWRKPIQRVVRAAEWGIVAHTVFAGLVPTGVPVDNAPILNALCAYVHDNFGGGTIRFDGMFGAIYLASSVYIPVGVSFDGVTRFGAADASGTDMVHGLRFRSRADGQFYDNTGTLRSVAVDGHCQAGILFWANVDWAAPTTWVRAYPDLNASTFQNLYIDGRDTGGIKGFRFAGSFRFRDITTAKVSTLVEKPNLYCDQVVIEGIRATARPNMTDYFIDLQGLGDGVEINRVESDQTGNSDDTLPPMVIRMGFTRGAVLNNIVNGNHLFVGSSNLTINNPHQEGGSFTFDQCDVTFNGGALYHGAGNPVTAPIIIQNSQGVNKDTCRVSLNDVIIQHPYQPVAYMTGWSSTPLIDVDIQTTRATLVMNGGCRRRATMGNIAHAWESIPMIGDSTAGGVLTNWKNYAHMLGSAPCSIIHKRVTIDGRMPNRSANWNGLTTLTYTPVTGETATYKGATGNNTYYARPLHDPVRLLGRSAGANTSVTIAVTNGASPMPGFYVDLASDATQGAVLWEVLRDTGNTGNYDKRALVPGIDMDRFVDDGNAVNSFAWEAYGPAAPATLNNNAMPVRVEYTDNAITLLDSIVGAPTVGTWIAGDEIRRPTSVPDGNGWKLDGTKCRAGGTPGTWDTRYALASLVLPLGTTAHGDVALALTFGTSGPTHLFNTSLTANRAVTFVTTSGTNGGRFRIQRLPTALGAFYLSVACTGVTYYLLPGEWIEVEFDGTNINMVASGRYEVILTVAALPAAAAALAGKRAMVSDANSAAFNAAVAAGGANIMPVFCTGAGGWKIG